MQRHGVRSLLMGGQACVFYGAAEFNEERLAEVTADKAYWAPLRKEIERLRRIRPQN